MRNSGQCIKCKSKRLWIVDQVRQPDFERDNCSWTMSVTTHSFRGDEYRGIARISAGTFQLFVCSACGYTEWYAQDFERLRDIPGARLVGDDSGDAGPYR
jgi:predicted nucleic-acid-binding Zn-ribbon protein